MQEITIPTCNNTSVGVIVWHPGCSFVLMQQRAKPPYGIACPAGHVDTGEDDHEAAARELQEETGLHVVRLYPRLMQRFDNACRRPGGAYHMWSVYEAFINGELTPKSDEVRSIGWYSLATIRDLSERTDDYRNGFINDLEWQQAPGLEPVWQDIFKRVGIL